MEEKLRSLFRSWWQQIKQRRVAIGVGAIVCVAVIVIIIIGYQLDWTSFNGYNKVTITHITSGTNAGTVTRTEEYQPGKGLWDWLQLLIIPLVLAVAALLFNFANSRTEQKIALDKQRQDSLQTYLDCMSELLLDKQLRTSEPDAEVRTVAHALTVSVLWHLDARRKTSLVKFLHDSKLLRILEHDADLSGADMGYINFSGFDLSEANLSGADLGNANLSGADLSMADLSGAILWYANLSGANLYNYDMGGANLHGANLHEANLSEANLGANLHGANLHGANPHGANLHEANLSEADLHGANLWGADLSYVDLTKADLSEADLGKANFTRAKVTIEQLNKAKSLKDTTMPDGSIHL